MKVSWHLIKVLMCTGVICATVVLVEQGVQNNETADFDDVFGNSRTQMKSTLCKIQKKYACFNDDVKGNHVLEYGRRAWQFPLQDTRLTLTYPPQNSVYDPLSDSIHLITGFKVILYMDAGDSKGFITNGGIFQGSITLQFDVSNVTTLGYQFWLYGVMSSPTHTLLSDYRNMCY